MDEIFGRTAHRPYPLPARPWRMRQRWNDLLFAHWPVRPEMLQARLPEGLVVDCHDGWAWLGVIPFTMDRVRVRAVGELAPGIPGVSAFPELNVRTYVRSQRTGLAGIYFFSLDAGSMFAVLGARVLFHLPYVWARMEARRLVDGSLHYRSERRLGRHKGAYAATYRPLGAMEASAPGSIEAFVTERYCLFTAFRGRLLVGDIHHVPWSLEHAEAEFTKNDVAEANGLLLPRDTAPLLYFARRLEVYIWPLREDTTAFPG